MDSRFITSSMETTIKKMLPLQKRDWWHPICLNYEKTMWALKNMRRVYSFKQL